MTEPTFKDRMAAMGLSFPEEEIASFEAFVGDLERAAEFVRALDHSYADEPSNVFSLIPRT